MNEIITELWIQWIMFSNYLTINFGRIAIVAAITFLILIFVRKGLDNGIR